MLMSASRLRETSSRLDLAKSIDKEQNKNIDLVVSGRSREGAMLQTNVRAIEAASE
jgi:hypothetical protein